MRRPGIELCACISVGGVDRFDLRFVSKGGEIRFQHELAEEVVLRNPANRVEQFRHLAWMAPLRVPHVIGPPRLEIQARRSDQAIRPWPYDVLTSTWQCYHFVWIAGLKVSATASMKGTSQLVLNRAAVFKFSDGHRVIPDYLPSLAFGC